MKHDSKTILSMYLYVFFSEYFNLKITINQHRRYDIDVIFIMSAGCFEKVCFFFFYNIRFIKK